MSNDLFDNVELVSLDSVHNRETCRFCGGSITTDISGEITTDECNMECGDGSNWLNDSIFDSSPSPLDFHDDD